MTKKRITKIMVRRIRNGPKAVAAVKAKIVVAMNSAQGVQLSLRETTVLNTLLVNAEALAESITADQSATPNETERALIAAERRIHELELRETMNARR